MVADPLEVAKTAILKNDHGSCGACESERNYPDRPLPIPAMRS